MVLSQGPAVTLRGGLTQAVGRVAEAVPSLANPIVRVLD